MTMTYPPSAPLSFIRQLALFDPTTFPHACHVIGTGATGSWVSTLLARQSVPELHLYDPDVLQPHNVPCGACDSASVGRRKVEALQEHLRPFPGTHVTPHAERVGATHRFTGVVFLCVHGMDDRRLIWQHALRFQPSVPLVIEMRVGPLEGRIYTVDPCDSLHVENWEEHSAYPEGHTESLSCTNRAIAATIVTVAALAVNQLTIWHARKAYAHFLSVGLDGIPVIHATRWTV